MSTAEDLYEKMRKAIQKGNHASMQVISKETNYDVNMVDKRGLGRVALHTAAQRNDQEAARILLSLPGVDPNKKTKEGNDHHMAEPTHALIKLFLSFFRIRIG